VTRERDGWSGVLRNVLTRSCPHQSVQLVSGTPTLGIKRPQHEPPTAEVKNEWRYTSGNDIPLWGPHRHLYPFPYEEKTVGTNFLCPNECLTPPPHHLQQKATSALCTLTDLLNSSNVASLGAPYRCERMQGHNKFNTPSILELSWNLNISVNEWLSRINVRGTTRSHCGVLALVSAMGLS
jgi:hypothetical protein